MDTGDLAIIETYEAVLSPLERDLLAEVRRLHTQIDEERGDHAVELQNIEERVERLRELEDDVERLEKELAEAVGYGEKQDALVRDSEEALSTLKASLRELVS